MKNIVVIGAGSHFKKNIFPAIQGLSGLKLRGVLNSTQASTDSVAKEINCLGYASVEEIKHDAQADVVYVATPPGTHFDIVETLAESKKDIWVEKSLCTTLEDWQKIQPIKSSFGANIFECFMFVHHPQLVQLADILDSGEYGETRKTRATFVFPHLNKDNFRYDKRLGGGGLLDAGCYPLKLSEVLFGNPERIDSQLFSDKGYDVDTYGSAHLIYDNHAVDLTWGFGLSYTNEVEIICEKAKIKLNRCFSKPSSLATTIDITSQSMGDKVIEIAPRDHFQLMFEHFLKNSGDDDWANGKMAEDLLHAKNLFYMRDSQNPQPIQR